MNNVAGGGKKSGRTVIDDAVKAGVVGALQKKCR
jgi:hypothetical protein